VKSPLNKDTIAALATAPGTGAIAVLRVSGPEAISIVDSVFTDKEARSKNLDSKKGNTIHFGQICDDEILLDEVLVSLFKAPHSYTGEDCVEISCHGSQYIQQQLLQLLYKKGCRPANCGEFTLRAFLNGKFDLSQAEAVADLIASNSGVSHQVAMLQMRGGFSNKIKSLRENLVNFASLIELELDFSEEDVEFADRADLKNLVVQIQRILERLIESFELGNVIKNGIPVAIVGKPNAGKSTLLNALLDDERAIVSEIPGTTRDTIEDELLIDGVLFRFIDTAGIRDTVDVIESMGVSRSLETMKKASIVMYIFDAHAMSSRDLDIDLEMVRKHIGDAQLVVVANKIDFEELSYLQKEYEGMENLIFISAKEKLYIEDLKRKLVALFDRKALNVTETVVTNARHADALRKANSSLYKVMDGLNKNISGDLLAMDIRYALNALGEITGEVTSDDLLGNIFSKFCIGK
jgi:tRNA modification GTPase